MTIEQTTLALEKYMPKAAAPIIAQWIHQSPCLFKIARNRSSKLGDYRSPYRGKGHRISVNHNLNPYAFLITTVHEFAHLKTWTEHKAKAKPHGIEWKKNFQVLMNPFFDRQVFPPDVQNAIGAYLRNPAASSCTDAGLYRALSRYDKPKTGVYRVEELPAGCLFILPNNGRLFKKGERIRTRFRCEEQKTGRIYLFSPMAEVNLVQS